MKTRSNRRKKRGIKALFCFLLAAELTLGSLSTPAQAEASEITTPETEKGTETPEITTPEAGVEETAEPTDPTLPPEKTDEESDANEQKQETTEPEETNPPATENTCICSSRCDIDNRNKECPVCTGNPDKCTYEAEEEPPADEPPTEEPPVEEPPIEKLPKQCTCTILCTEGSIDTGCPVCVEDSSLCTPVTVTEEAPQVALLSDLEEEPNPLADKLSAEQCICTILCTEDSSNNECPVCKENISLCMRFQDDSSHLYYKVVEGGVEVSHDGSYLSLTGSLTIPKEVFDGTNTYPVVGIGDHAFTGCTGLGTITFEPDSVTKKIGENAFRGCTGLGTITIPDSVTTIGPGAFYACTGLKEITIPDSVTEMGVSVFMGCTGLTKATLSDKISIIAGSTFHDCTSLSEITIPASVREIHSQAFSNCQSLSTFTPDRPTTMTIPGTVESIGTQAFEGCNMQTLIIENGVNVVPTGFSAFSGCKALETVIIPKSIEIIHPDMFENCEKLKSVTILHSSSSVVLRDGAFQGCGNLTSLSIAVDGSNTTATIDPRAYPFDGCPEKRYLTFVTEDGTELDESSDAFKTAKAAYDDDHIAGDGKWWGWTIGKASETPEPPAPTTYAVTIKAMLDGEDWDESKYGKKTFALRKGDGSYLEDLTAVEAGTYGIYERIETPEQTAARAVSYQTTKKTVTVVDKNVDVTINYYTATFYDDVVDRSPSPYGDTTDQHPKIVVESVGFEPPPSPTKDKHTFSGWKTEDGGDFDFEGGLAAKTDIYASWTATTEDSKTYLITAKAGEHGSISPEDDSDIEVTEDPDRTLTIKVPEGRSCTFNIQAETGYKISAVIVDGTNLGALDRYTFPPVSSDHAIEAVFEKINPGGGGTDPDNPGGGDGSDPDDSDDDHSGGGISGGSSNAGSSGSGISGGGTSGSSSDAGSSGGGISGGGGSTDSTNLSADSSLPEAGAPAKTADTVSGTNTNTNVSGSRPGEPKTGDASHLEVYASIAMIAGFVYLILYLMDGMKGMSEEEKNRRIASLLGWAKRGKAKTLRRYIAITAVFFVLAYYHAFGKRAALEWQKA